jgi:hypothetical protein
MCHRVAVRRIARAASATVAGARQRTLAHALLRDRAWKAARAQHQMNIIFRDSADARCRSASHHQDRHSASSKQQAMRIRRTSFFCAHIK